MLKNKCVLAFGLLDMAIGIVYHLHELDLNLHETIILYTLWSAHTSRDILPNSLNNPALGSHTSLRL